MASRDEIYVELDEILSKLTAKPDISKREKSETVTIWTLYILALLLLFLSQVVDGESLLQIYIRDVFQNMSTALFGATVVYSLFQKFVVELKIFGRRGHKYLRHLVGLIFLLAIVFYILYYGYIVQHIASNEPFIGELFLDLGGELLSALIIFFSLERILKAIETSYETEGMLRDRFNELRQKLQTAPK